MSEREERAEPFLAYVTKSCVEKQAKGPQSGPYYNIDSNPGGSFVVPVVVTPLLPGDPRPGETWLDQDGDPITVGSIYYDHVHKCMYANGPERGDIRLCDLHRPPVMKTFRIGSHVGIDGCTYSGSIVRAESREAALAKLAESLEEVP